MRGGLGSSLREQCSSLLMNAFSGLCQTDDSNISEKSTINNAKCRNVLASQSAMRSELLRGNLYSLTQHQGFHWNGPWQCVAELAGQSRDTGFSTGSGLGTAEGLAFWTSGFEEHVQVISSKFNFFSLEFSIFRLFNLAILSESLLKEIFLCFWAKPNE